MLLHVPLAGLWAKMFPTCTPLIHANLQFLSCCKSCRQTSRCQICSDMYALTHLGTYVHGHIPQVIVPSMQQLPEFPPPEGERRLMSFRRVLLNTCQEEFEGAAAAREVSYPQQWTHFKLGASLQASKA